MAKSEGKEEGEGSKKERSPSARMCESWPAETCCTCPLGEGLASRAPRSACGPHYYCSATEYSM